MKRIILVIMIRASRYILLLVLVSALFAVPAQLPISYKIKCPSVDACEKNNEPTVFRNRSQMYLTDAKGKTDHYFYCDSTGVYDGRSVQGGKREPIRISHRSGNSPVSCAGPHGAVFVAWMGSKAILFQRSDNQDGNWLPAEKELVTVKTDYLYREGGAPVYGDLGIACDTSSGDHNGRLYICWSDIKYSAAGRDVFLMYSDDNGQNWTEPVLVTYRPNHKAQFMPRMAIDQRTGFLYLIYYDTQNQVGGQLVDVYLALSKNGGLQFGQFKVNSESFALSSRASDNVLAFEDEFPTHINWSQHKKKERMCYTVRLSDSAYVFYDKQELEREQRLSIAKTVVFGQKIILPFTLDSACKLTAIVTKPLEPAFKRIVFTGKAFKQGKNTLMIDAQKLGLKKGNYTLFLYYTNTNRFIWITEE